MTPANVLIVEDENIIALDLKRILIRSGYAVSHIANSGDEALAAVAAAPPDAVLMDIGLGGEMDGIQTSQHILEQLDIPIIFVTANSDLATVRKSQNANPFGYVLKPFDEREISIVLEMAFFKHQADKEVKESRRWLSAILQSIGEGVIATDSNGRVKFINPIALRLTGWKEAEASGRLLPEVFNVIYRETRQALDNPVESAQHNKQALSYANLTVLMQKDGGEIPIDIFVSPITDDKANLNGVVLTFRKTPGKAN
ncbi:MAG: response regulator [Chloroflexi bacterium]|nr:response regulator [Chloroflexota bacterium]MBI5080416.1 response regulator [Chloroflexota bacterium]MBI5350386.1 response regulator [Chloroflexota bacterium]MBI5712189.1 response regulator [Chloroflexota bacterium]